MTSSFPEKLDSLISEEQDNSEEEDWPLDDVVDLQLQQLGPNPTLLQAVSVILKQSPKAEYEAKQARKKLERDFRETVKVVKENCTEMLRSQKMFHSVVTFENFIVNFNVMTFFITNLIYVNHIS